jgi:hypothetical protein
VSRDALNRDQFSEHLPPEPGSQSIPEGHVRLWHYTSDPAIPSIREHGLTQHHAKGESYGEPSVVWAAAGEHEPPKKHALQERPYVEFHADPHKELDIGRTYQPATTEDLRHMYGYGSHVTMRGDVPPSRFLAVHEPWHQHVRHIESSPQSLKDYTTGDFSDFDTGDPDVDKALDFVRRKHAAGGYK